ncbi:SDR family NAD(P)-dependent oxidoreductase [Nocardia brasiliensis]|uniref:SDR family NAD(P)-dependent oxidoreductase n=1 Tax=Nocardia brasiliensis TaxID=37326 RepID=UPI00031374FB|nr:SDR family NAD(P)-dependent oxidoreductase [Nocardia brasiliensis]OCF85830.1 short-chain dehydrogenase [Nocardia brasiliensis]
MGSRNWFITGASRGLGREWALAALERGDRVAATARTVATLDELVERFGDAVVPIQLDVAQRSAGARAIQCAHNVLGRLDVVVNNAGYGQLGMVEELDDAQIDSVFETNVFGAIRIVRAALPILRAQRSGHIIAVSSLLGQIAYPGAGAYAATKFALEAFHEALAAEVSAFGIAVTIIEPQGFSTGFNTSMQPTTTIEAYRDIRDATTTAAATRSPGDPAATRAALLTLVDAASPPLRLLFGNDGLERITAAYESRLATWQAWHQVSIAAHGNSASHVPGGPRFDRADHA